MRPCKVKLCQRNELKMGSSDHDSQKIPAMMMYEIKMTILGRVEPRGAGMSNFLVGASLCFGHKLPL